MKRFLDTWHDGVIAFACILATRAGCVWPAATVTFAGMAMVHRLARYRLALRYT
jgi:hypothetical protein